MHFLEAWQSLPLRLDPVLFSVGALKVHYYGLSYLAAALTVYLLTIYRLKHEKIVFDQAVLNQGVVWGFFGMWLGARLLFVAMHPRPYFLNQPLNILFPFVWRDGLYYVGILGMSSHGGLLGLAAAGWIYCRRHKLSFWKLGDLLAPCIPLGYMWGRLGNFINEDMHGRVTTVPWGMYFKFDSANLRHPVALYEAFFEGTVLFVALWVIRRQKRKDGFLVASYVIGYGLIRYPLEFLKETSTLYFGVFSFGQVASLLFILLGMITLKPYHHPPVR